MAQLMSERLFKPVYGGFSAIPGPLNGGDNQLVFVLGHTDDKGRAT